MAAAKIAGGGVAVDVSVKVAEGAEASEAVRMSRAELMVAAGNVASRGRVRKAITWGMAEEDIRIGRRW